MVAFLCFTNQNRKENLDMHRTNDNIHLHILTNISSLQFQLLDVFATFRLFVFIEFGRRQKVFFILFEWFKFFHSQSIEMNLFSSWNINVPILSLFNTWFLVYFRSKSFGSINFRHHRLRLDCRCRTAKCMQNQWNEGNTSDRWIGTWIQCWTKRCIAGRWSLALQLESILQVNLSLQFHFICIIHNSQKNSRALRRKNGQSQNQHIPVDHFIWIQTKLSRANEKEWKTQRHTFCM